MAQAQMKHGVLVPDGGHLPHDTDGTLFRMGHDATAKVFAAFVLQKSSPVRKQLFKEAMCIRLQEKKGWLAVRTEQFPAGDLEGAAQASLAIACYYMELDEHDKGQKWLQRAMEEVPKDKEFMCAVIEHNMDELKKIKKINKEINEECSRSSTPVQSASP